MPWKRGVYTAEPTHHLHITSTPPGAQSFSQVTATHSKTILGFNLLIPKLDPVTRQWWNGTKIVVPVMATRPQVRIRQLIFQIVEWIYHFPPYFLSIEFTHLPLDKMATISQKKFQDTFLWMKSFVFQFKISLKFVPEGPTENDPALVQIMTWRWICDKPLSEPMQTRFTDAYKRHLG